MTTALPPDTPPADPPALVRAATRIRRVRLSLPCDRCSAVGPLHPTRPGELLCAVCAPTTTDRSTA